MVNKKEIIDWLISEGVTMSNFIVPFKHDVFGGIDGPKSANDANSRHVAFGMNSTQSENAGFFFCDKKAVAHKNQVQFVSDNPKLWFAKCCWEFFPPEKNEMFDYVVGVGADGFDLFTTFSKNYIEGNIFPIGQGSVIGGDGFGFVRDIDGKLIRFPHYGKVIIHEGVEIGSNTTIDHGSLSDTVIGAGTKIDNLVHIAHNVKIGENCLIVAGSVICGSAEIGDNTFIGANATIKNGIKVGKNCTVGMGAVVVKDVPDNTTVKGNPAR